MAFRVPTESDTASTTKLEVAIPTDKPIASVGTMPVPGWTVAVEKSKLATPIKSDDGDVTEAISKITWTANSADTAIKPGQFQEFPVSLGPLPDTDKLVFKALQTYSDGNVVRWIDEAVEGQAEPAHPAPVLKLAKPAAATVAASAAPSPVAAVVSQPRDGTARVLAIVALALGLVGLFLGARAMARTRAGSPPAG